jgi:hypothetical protein
VRRINKSSARGKRRHGSSDATSTAGGDDDDDDATRGGSGDKKREWWPPTSEFDAEKDAYERYSDVMLGLLEEAAASERRGGTCAPVAWL